MIPRVGVQKNHVYSKPEGVSLRADCDNNTRRGRVGLNQWE